MKRKIVVGALALLFSTGFFKPAQANPIAAPACKDMPSCGVAGVVIGTEIIGGVLYYLVKTTSGVVHKVRSKQQQIPAHRSYEEKLSTSTSSTRCYDLAEEETAKTGRTWRVKSNLPVRGTGGVSKPGHLLQWECVITDEPER